MSDGQTESDVSLEPSSKKLKIDQQNDNGVKETRLILSEFIPEKILNNNTNRKTVCLVGKFKDKDGVALVLLEKNVFKEEELDESGYFSAKCELRTFFQNDIYGNFECLPSPSLNGGWNVSKVPYL